MKPTKALYPLVKVPHDIQLPLYLIKEELKSRKLFHILQEAGMTDCQFKPHLDSLILQTIGLDGDDDRISDKYFEVMENRSKKLEANQNSMMKQAFKAYNDILVIRRKFAGRKK